LNTYFEGTANIKRGEWFKIVTSNGGTNNTSDDRTYYYEVFPSNNELDFDGIRKTNAVINQIGGHPNGVIKRKKVLAMIIVLMAK
jgi:hypothetical protein